MILVSHNITNGKNEHAEAGRGKVLISTWQFRHADRHVDLLPCLCRWCWTGGPSCFIHCRMIPPPVFGFSFCFLLQVELDKGLMRFIRAATQNYGKVRSKHEDVWPDWLAACKL